MLEVTSDYIKAIENPLRMFEASFGLNGKTYTKAKIASATYDSSVGNSNDFTIGGGYINSLEIEIKEIIEGLQEMMPATMSVAISGKVVPLGRFFVTEVKLDRNDKKTKIKLLDEFARLGGVYDSTLKYPAFARDVFKEIVQLTGISVETNIQLINDQVAAKLEKTSYREALIYLAQLSGSFVRFNRNGKLDFIKLQTTSRHITKDMYKPSGLERDELPYRLKGIECESADKVVYKSGLSTGNVMKLKNPWMTQAILDRVFNEYRDFNFYPYTLSWRGDMAMEAGDWVTVHWDENIYFDIPMLSYKLSFDGGLSADSSGSAAGTAQGSYQYKGAMQRQIEYLDELITKQGSMYLDTSIPNNPKDGDIWFKPNGGYVEMWERVAGDWVKKADSANVGEIVDTISTDELLAKKVSAAIANFISINAKNITAGDLDIARLRVMNGLSEVLTVRDGKVVLNVEQLNINAQQAATKEDLKNIELTPGPAGTSGKSLVFLKMSEETSMTREMLQSYTTAGKISNWSNVLNVADLKKADTAVIPVKIIGENKNAQIYGEIIDISGTSVITSFVGILEDGEAGEDGLPGKNGLGITSTEITYAGSPSGTNAPISGWSNSVPVVVPGSYLWTKVVWTYSDESVETSYSVSHIGENGNDGEDGIPGKDGVGIASTTIQYASSQSGTVEPTDGWSNEIPSVAPGFYLWTKTTWSYDDQTSETSYSVAKQGETGVGIRTVTEYYLATSANSGVTPSTPGWTETIQTVSATNKYLWNYTRTTLTNGSSTNTQAVLIGTFGEDGVDGNGISSITEYYLASVSETGVTTSTPGWTTTVQQVTESKRFLWNYAITRYTNGTSKTSPVLLLGAYGPKGDTGTFDDDLSVENLLRGTKDMIKKGNTPKDDWYLEGAVLTDETVDSYPFTFKKWSSGAKTSPSIEIAVKSGIEYTFTAYIARENVGRLYFYLYDTWDYHITSATRRETIIQNVGPDIQRFKITFIPTRDGKIRPRFAMSSSDQGWFMAGGYKLNYGKVATGWSQAPEDIDKAINDVKQQAVLKTDISVTNEGIIHSASKTVNGQTIASMIAQRAEWVEIIARLLKVKGDMIVDGSLEATKFKSNLISSLDGTLVFDLAKSALVSYSDKSSIRRVTDSQSQFIKMATSNKITYTTIGANRTANDESIGTADFTGLQFRSRSVANGGLIDEADLWADSLYISGGGQQSDGVHFKNGQWFRPTSNGRLYLGMNDRRWREVHSNEYYINGIVLSAFLKSLKNCFAQLANGGATQSTYDYIKGQISNILNKLP